MSPPFMKLYVADYLGDTHHLSCVEHGAYMLLLMAMWRAGGTLPAQDKNLAKLARCTPEEWAEIRDVILPFFKHSRGRLTHKRVAEELAKYESISGKRSEAGKRGASGKANKNNGPGPAIGGFPEGKSRHNQNQSQNQSQKEEPPVSPPTATVLPFGPVPVPAPPRQPEVPEPQRGKRATASRGSRLAGDWRPSQEDRAYAANLGFDDRAIDRIGETFRDYWLAAPGQRGVKADWPATWRTWTRKEADRNPPRPPPQAQAEWC